MKRILTLSIDVEDWYHLPYLCEVKRNSSNSVLDGLDFFISICDKFGIAASFFVVGELLEKHIELFRLLAQRGHDVGYHTMYHKRPMDMSEDEFRQDLIRGKELLSEVGMTRYIFRAPLFGIDNFMHRVLGEEGYSIDSSYINFDRHPKYGRMSAEEWLKLDKDIYWDKDRDIYEFGFQLSRSKWLHYPLSGGAYFRFLPWVLLKSGLTNVFKSKEYLNFYIHPFELSCAKFSLKGASYVERFRFYFGRKMARIRLVKLIQLAMERKYSFTTYTNLYEEYSSHGS